MSARSIPPDHWRSSGLRQAVLKRYFDPVGGEAAFTPTVGHRGLADLCASGRVRVIVTTNFDHLIERALDQVGVTPQVITTPGAVRGMVPFPHAPVTVLKVHGDYTLLGLRNSPEELNVDPRAWSRVLDRVFDEWGLVVVGWSGEYDVAMNSAIAKAPSRRYPMYWASYRAQITESARRLIDLRRATVIDTVGADEFLQDIKERVDKLDQVEGSPLSGPADGTPG